MVTVIGGTGNIGYTTARALREAGMPVRLVLHDTTSASRGDLVGFEVAYADIQDRASVTRAIAGANSVQVIVPLRPKTADPVVDMRMSVDSLLAALETARPARVLAISDYGAHVSRDIGMPTIFHHFRNGS